MGSPPHDKREQRFRAIHDAAYADVLRFVRRRVSASDADDVVGEVMLVAWRRLDDVPADLSDARAWLFGIARNTILNSRRGNVRRDALTVRLAEVPLDLGDRSGLAELRVDIAAAWPMLSESEQETLALAVLDGLSAPEAGAVLGISATAFRLRLSRARRALRSHLALPERSFR